MNTSKIKNRFTYIAIALFFPFSLFNAFGEKRAEQSSPFTDGEEIVVEFYSIPSPDEILSYIRNNEIQYTQEILTDETQISKYRTSTEKLIALGLNLADMAYSISYNQTSTSLNYFEVVEDLGKNLNIFPPEVEEIGQRIIKNMNRLDSLNMLYDEVYLTIIGNLHETRRFGEYAIISAGGFVESLYLALNSKGTKIMEDEFNQKVWEQKMIMDQLHKMFDRYLSSSVKTKMLKDIAPLTEAFNKFVQHNAVTSAATQVDGSILIGMPPTNETETPPITEIIEEVNKLRNEWVK